MKSNDVKQDLKNYKLRKRCNFNRLIASINLYIILFHYVLVYIYLTTPGELYL